MITVHNCVLMWAASKALSAVTSSGGQGPHTLIAVLIFLSLSEVPMSGCSDRHISQTQELAHRLQTSPQSAAAGKLSSQGSSCCCSCSCSLPPHPHSHLLLLPLLSSFLLLLRLLLLHLLIFQLATGGGSHCFVSYFSVFFCFLYTFLGGFEWSVFLLVLSVFSFKHLFFRRGSGKRGGSEFTFRNGIGCVLDADALIEVVLLAVGKQVVSICTGEKVGRGTERADWWSAGSQRAG